MILVQAYLVSELYIFLMQCMDMLPLPHRTVDSLWPSGLIYYSLGKPTLGCPWPWLTGTFLTDKIKKVLVVGMCTKPMYCFFAIQPCNSKSVCSTALILLQNKTLGIWPHWCKIWISKNALLCHDQVFTNEVTNFKQSLVILGRIFKFATIYSYSNDCTPSHQFYIDLKILQNHRCVIKE